MKPLRRAAAAVTVAWAALLVGCGFKPVYSSATVSALERTDVQTGQGRTAYLIRESLVDQLARDRALPPLYRVRVDATEARGPLGNRVNNIASRYALSLGVRYVLTEVASGKVLQQGFVPVDVTYDSADPPYAGVVAQQNAEERAAAQAAVRLRLELSRAFIPHGSK